MKKSILIVCLSSYCAIALPAAERFVDRFVWIFGWGLHKDSDVGEISKVLETAAEHRFNGAVFSLGMDTLCQQPPDFFRRLEQIKKCCDENGLDLIPSLFSIGYGGGVLAHDPNLAEGLPVQDAPFLVRGDTAFLADTNVVSFRNGGFEEFKGNRFAGFDFCDQPGEVSFADTQIRHDGKAALRLENFTANRYGHGRVMQTVRVQPHRCYRLTLWVKTEGLQPANAFRVTVLAGNRELAPREFHVPSTTDWRQLSMLFNSLDYDKVSLYAGMWGGQAGKVWLDDWTVEEVGPVNVLHRPGTPATVRSADGSLTYTEGKDYAPLRDPHLRPWRDDGPAQPLKLLPGSRIHDGQRLRVSWYHSMLIHDSQVTVCMAEPALYEILDHEAKLLAEKVQPGSVLLNMDEIRMGGTCRACQGRNMGELLGECIGKEEEILHHHIPSLQVYTWSDMFDPHHNAHGNYYLVKGDFTGSWTNAPKSLIMTVWGGAPRPESLHFFADQGFRTLVACYYDAADLTQVKGWLALAPQIHGLRGFMYTPWQKKYSLLPEFGELINKPKGAKAAPSASEPESAH